MDKWQAIHAFWNSFDIPAYDENSVPDDAPLPYITYSAIADAYDEKTPLTASIWYRGSSWAEVSRKADEISEKVPQTGYFIQKIEGGYAYITRGVPFAQRMSDPTDDSIRRVYVNCLVEFLTAY